MKIHKYILESYLLLIIPQLVLNYENCVYEDIVIKNCKFKLFISASQSCSLDEVDFEEDGKLCMRGNQNYNQTTQVIVLKIYKLFSPSIFKVYNNLKWNEWDKLQWRIHLNRLLPNQISFKYHNNAIKLYTGNIIIIINGEAYVSHSDCVLHHNIYEETNDTMTNHNPKNEKIPKKSIILTHLCNSTDQTIQILYPEKNIGPVNRSHSETSNNTIIPETENNNNGSAIFLPSSGKHDGTKRDGGQIESQYFYSRCTFKGFWLEYLGLSEENACLDCNDPSCIAISITILITELTFLAIFLIIVYKII